MWSRSGDGAPNSKALFRLLSRCAFSLRDILVGHFSRGPLSGSQISPRFVRKGTRQITSFGMRKILYVGLGGYGRTLSNRERISSYTSVLQLCQPRRIGCCQHNPTLVPRATKYYGYGHSLGLPNIGGTSSRPASSPPRDPSFVPPGAFRVFT